MSARTGVAAVLIHSQNTSPMCKQACGACGAASVNIHRIEKKIERQT